MSNHLLQYLLNIMPAIYARSAGNSARLVSNLGGGIGGGGKGGGSQQVAFALGKQGLRTRHTDLFVATKP